MKSSTVTVSFALLVVGLIFILIATVHDVGGGTPDASDVKAGSLVAFVKQDTRLPSTANAADVDPISELSSTEPMEELLSKCSNFTIEWAKERASFKVKDTIFLDWNIDSYLFTYLHYKSLESAFVSYPMATFKLLIVGPNAANYYKINNLISKHQFQKYKKRGYAISPVVVNSVQAPAGSPLLMTYWAEQEPQYCSTKGKKQVQDVLTAPYHVWMYVRLQSLLVAKGGISFDFSWLHAKPIDADINFGFSMSTVCSVIGDANRKEERLIPSTSLLYPYNDTTFRESVYRDCYTSSYIVLRKKFISDRVYEKILMCVLEKYDEESFTSSDTLSHCFEKDRLTGGALCLEIALTGCFREIGVPNQLDKNSALYFDSSISRFQNSGSSSQLMTFNWQSDSASSWQLQSQIHKGLFHCDVSSILSYYEKMSSLYPDLVSSCSEAQGYNETLHQHTTFVKMKTTSVDNRCWPASAIWMGRNLGTRRVINTRNVSQVHHVVVPFTKWESEKNELDWLVPDTKTVIHGILTTLALRMCRPVAGGIVGGGFGVRRDTCSHFDLNRLTANPITDTSSSAHVPFVENFRTSLSCSINFVIPGFMKCASSFLFEALTNHPQVLRALKGVNFKETGCYLPPVKGVTRVDSPNHRMNCFPFIESHESNYIYGDATVTYSANIDVPHYLQRDNANVKSIFVVREPISRMESHFRFSLGLFKSLGFDTVDSAVAFALKNGSHLHSLRDDAISLLTDLKAIDASNKNISDGEISIAECLSNLWIIFFRFNQCAEMLSHSSEHSMVSLHARNNIQLYISKFFVPSGAKSREERLTSLIIRTSIYFPVIAHWSMVMRSRNILVVENEKLRISSKAHRVVVAMELKRIHRFLNIAEHGASVPGQSVHKTEKGAGVSASSPISRAVLQEFYHPFNELLDILVEVSGIASGPIHYNEPDA